jgi:hypothetical protein
MSGKIGNIYQMTVAKLLEYANGVAQQMTACSTMSGKIGSIYQVTVAKLLERVRGVVKLSRPKSLTF